MDAGMITQRENKSRVRRVTHREEKNEGTRDVA